MHSRTCRVQSYWPHEPLHSCWTPTTTSWVYCLDILSPLPACSPLPSESVFPFLFVSMIIHQKKTTAVNFLFFVVNHSKCKIWDDKYGKYVFNLTWWIAMSETLSALPSKKLLLYSSYSLFFLLMRDIGHIYFILYYCSHFISFRMTEEFSCLWNLNN